MSTAGHFYRGLEIYSLIYTRSRTEPGFGRKCDEGYDAAVRIQEWQRPGETTSSPRSRVFRLAANTPFSNTGDARRASIVYAERLIDECPSTETIFDMEN